MIGINTPIRISKATMMPADVVLGRAVATSAVAEQVVQYSEITHLRDLFGHQRLREGKYTAGQIDTVWTAPIEADFTEWRRANIGTLPVAKEQVEAILKRHQR